MTLYSIAITLILVMDPLGNIPMFLSILQKFSPERQARIILREVLIAFVILVVFVFFGNYIMRWLHLSTDAVGVAGGIILFLISLRMIFPPETKENGDKDVEEPFIVPLAVPLTAGPSALAMVLLFSAQEPTRTWTLFAAVVISTIIFLAIMLSSRYLMRLLGKRGLIAVERLMGMILTVVAVQMFLVGIVHFIQNQ